MCGSWGRGGGGGEGFWAGELRGAMGRARGGHGKKRVREEGE